MVYAGNGDAAYTTTAAGYYGGQAAEQQALGNSDGYIAENRGPGAVVVGTGPSLDASTWLVALGCLVTFAAAFLG